MKHSILIVFLNILTFAVAGAHGEPEKVDVVSLHPTMNEFHLSKMANNSKISLNKSRSLVSYPKISSRQRAWSLNNQMATEPSNIFCRDLKFKFRISENMNLILSYN